ncbi:unnamed protein product [Closterium sp. NIES-54]
MTDHELLHANSRYHLFPLLPLLPTPSPQPLSPPFPQPLSPPSPLLPLLIDAAALARQRLSMTDHKLLHSNSPYHLFPLLPFPFNPPNPPRFRLMDVAALARQRLSMTDHELLHANSTSPLAEGPDFLPFIRRHALPQRRPPRLHARSHLAALAACTATAAPAHAAHAVSRLPLAPPALALLAALLPALLALALTADTSCHLLVVGTGGCIEVEIVPASHVLPGALNKAVPALVVIVVVVVVMVMVIMVAALQAVVLGGTPCATHAMCGAVLKCGAHEYSIQQMMRVVASR